MIIPFQGIININAKKILVRYLGDNIPIKSYSEGRKVLTGFSTSKDD